MTKEYFIEDQGSPIMLSNMNFAGVIASTVDVTYESQKVGV